MRCLGPSDCQGLPGGEDIRKSGNQKARKDTSLVPRETVMVWPGPLHSQPTGRTQGTATLLCKRVDLGPSPALLSWAPSSQRLVSPVISPGWLLPRKEAQPASLPPATYTGGNRVCKSRCRKSEGAGVLIRRHSHQGTGVSGPMRSTPLGEDAHLSPAWVKYSVILETGRW